MTVTTAKGTIGTTTTASQRAGSGTYLQKVKSQALGGRAEICEFSRAPGKFYLRVYVPATETTKRRYEHRQIVDATNLEEAEANALEVYMGMQSPVMVKDRSKPKRGRPAQPAKAERGLPMAEAFRLYLADQYKRIGAMTGVNITERVYKNREEQIRNHLQPYCWEHNIRKTTDIVLDSFDNYELWRKNIKKHTIRNELSMISFFLKWCKRKNHLTVDTEMKFDDLIELPELLGIDMQGNPPFVDEDWDLFNKNLRDWVKASEGVLPSLGFHNARVCHWRHMVWTLLMVLKTSGMRPCEAFRLTWEDVEFVAYPRESKSSGTGTKLVAACVFKVYDDKKTGMPREVGADCSVRLLDWRERIDRMLEDKRAKGKNYPLRKETDLIFGNYDNDCKPFTYSNISKAFREDLRDPLEDQFIGPRNTKTNKYTIYSCRSTRVNELVNRRVDPLIIAKQLGHSPQTMMKFYQRGDVRDRAMVEAVLGAIPFGEKPMEKKVFKANEITAAKARKLR